MAGIVTNLTSKGCVSHRSITVNLDGSSFTFDVSQDELNAMTWNNPAKREFIMAGLKRLVVGGMTLEQALHRVCNGEEATNVKMYDFFGPGAAITKTNIGTAYVNICPGLNGERLAADFTGCTQFRFLLSANLVGTGQFGARCVRDSDSAVLIENANLGAAGERELDSDWQNLPAAFLGQGIMFLRVQGKSQTAADDPVFRRCTLGLR